MDFVDCSTKNGLMLVVGCGIFWVEKAWVVEVIDNICKMHFPVFLVLSLVD
jgi:hypothetical protein